MSRGEGAGVCSAWLLGAVHAWRGDARSRRDRGGCPTICVGGVGGFSRVVGLRSGS
jgi:hypothetical protein